jgi:hypothetical protein
MSKEAAASDSGEGGEYYVGGQRSGPGDLYATEKRKGRPVQREKPEVAAAETE